MSSMITPEDSKTLFDRRDFLRLMGASIALLPLEACRDKMAPESLVPYVQAPAERLLGTPEAYATALPYYGLSQGLLVTSHEGRPTKIEGHPKHPMSFGATSIYAQASVLDLYDPFRLKKPKLGSTDVALDSVKFWLSTMSAEQKKKRGAGFCLITEPLTSPSLIAAIENLKKQWPEMLWISWSPLHQDEVFAGTELAFGQTLCPFYDFKNAGHILSLDHDFLGSEHDAVARARAWADRRRSGKARALHVYETTMSLTGTKADQRTPATEADLERILAAIEARNGNESKFLRDGVDPLVLLGTHASADWHARVFKLNMSLASNALKFRNPVHSSHAAQTQQVHDFIDRARSGQITSCIVIGGNPVFNTPADLDVAAALHSIKETLHLTESENETSRACRRVAPRSHYLETWGDVETPDGTQSLIQPLILPLYESLDDHQIFEIIEHGDHARSTQALVAGFWRERGVNDSSFHEALATGVVGHTAAFVTPTLRTIAVKRAEAPETEPDLSLRFAPDPTLLDGRFAENAWLQELPKPVTALTWDNAVLMAPALAKKLNARDEEHVEIHTSVGQLTAPIFILDGLPEKVITLHFGSGRSIVSPVGEKSGFDAYRLRSRKDQGIIQVASIKKVAGTTQLARLQTEMPTEREDLYTTKPEQSAHTDIGHGEPPATSTAIHSKEYQWAMSIDLDTCTGCMNCVVACQAENNIPVVGKQQVINGRIMHWMRIDRYKSDGIARPQPVTCMHCEKAPCEVVCPVQATVHSSEGLNQMVYNRCVGTRYCSNNCPYKVRRFNFYKYTDDKSETLKMQRNPDVTVRSRGVMEKCSYCVHRITRARIHAEKEDRLIRDGEIRTACQAACPPQAIVFGNLLDPKSEVNRLRKNQRTYGLLTDLGTRPRTTYMAAKPSVKDKA